MSLRLLLFLTGAMLAVSGGVKLKAMSKAGLGLAPLALLEMIAAVALAGSSVSDTFAVPGMRWAVPLGVLLLLVSSVSHALRLKQHRQRRAETEGGRLQNFLKYSGGPNRGE
ncbi:MAG: hypothetical protein O2958_12975 [Gemmatimonadetes bacterium]|nr:hypothetical protein [Gemmatimonadota bacterium]MDA1103671.1 hypothetical protein [Gemmatimonadota bacterium]